MKPKKPNRGMPSSKAGSDTWARALRKKAEVANDNGHGYRRRRDDPPAGSIVHLEIAPPKAG